METKRDIWLAVCEGQFPRKSEDQIMAYSTKAASDWYHGDDTELAKLFEQYVMIKTLKGIKNGDEKDDRSR